ncbi:MAG: Gfo/Idh/MocA family oxidoreductase [Vicinamibacteria bacterium]
MGSESSRTRRHFIKSSAVAAGAAALEHRFAVLGNAAPDAPIRVGVIGCGGRGTGAVLNVLQAATSVIYPERGYHTEDVIAGADTKVEGVAVVALADLFPDRLAACRAQIRKVGVEVRDDACSTGFDAYEKLLAREDVNYVILACPPHFRPRHFRAAVEAGKNVFMEKPIAVDATGVRAVLEAGELAKKKGLGVGAGTQRRHEAAYIETIERLQDGAIGQISTCRTYFNSGRVWVVERQPGWSDLEWQIRNWVHMTWVSGDHIVEQHLHSLDAANWVLGGHPLSARGLGGRQAHASERYGNVYDHFAVEYEYADGVRMFSQCRQTDNCDNLVATFVDGTDGRADCRGMIWGPDGKGRWRYRDRDAPNPYEQEHADLIRSIREGHPLNETRSVAEATLTAIMGRESAYSGRVITWEQALASKQDFALEKYDFYTPHAIGAVPMPGTYELA